MQVSIETTSGLERRLTVGVPATEIDNEVNKRLQQAAKTTRINGFRKGKVPMKVVRQRFGAGVRQEVVGETINRSLQKAFEEQKLRPAGQPQIEPKQLEEGKDLEYTATFEVYPEVDLKGIDGVEITRFKAEVTEQDVDDMIDTLRKSQASWKPAEREARDGDQVNIDFVGKKDGEAFDGGSAEGHNLVLGSNSMIPGFEDGLVGAKSGEEKVLNLTFPEDYQVDDLKGAEVEFTVTVNAVEEQVLPELNEDFFKSFGVESNDVDAFRSDVKENMDREKDRIAKTRVKTQVLDALLAANEIEVPAALIANEIQALRQQALQQYGQMNSQLDMASLLPDELFRERAERRTALGLLISEVVVREKLTADKDRLKTMIDEIAATYEDPQSVVNYYYGNQELLAGAEAAVLEDQVVDHLLSKAAVDEKTIPYQELVKPEQAAEQEV